MPVAVAESDFWYLYLYKASQLTAQELRAAKLFETAANDSEEDLDWGDEDEAEEEKVKTTNMKEPLNADKMTGVKQNTDHSLGTFTAVNTCDPPSTSTKDALPPPPVHETPGLGPGENLNATDTPLLTETVCTSTDALEPDISTSMGKHRPSFDDWSDDDEVQQDDAVQNDDDDDW